MPSTLRNCVVCGAGSHRDQWINVSGEYVACDRHTAAEVANAVAALKPPVATPAPKVAASVPPPAPPAVAPAVTPKAS